MNVIVDIVQLANIDDFILMGQLKVKSDKRLDLFQISIFYCLDQIFNIIHINFMEIDEVLQTPKWYYCQLCHIIIFIMVFEFLKPFEINFYILSRKLRLKLQIIFYFIKLFVLNSELQIMNCWYDFWLNFIFLLL